MFIYYDGYEIDGSDTSYNLVFPDMELCKEVLKYYLSLKTVDKNKPITLDKKPFLEDLLGNIFTSGSNHYLEYSYISFESAYPEVKREIITLLAQYNNIDESKLKNPVACGWNGYESTHGCIDIYPTNKAKKIFCDASNMNHEKYASIVVQGDFWMLELTCAIGGLLGIYLYNLHKLRKRFPELQIDLSNITYVDECLEKTIQERISVNSYDIAGTLRTMMTVGDLYFYNNRYPNIDISKTTITPRNLSRYLVKTSKENYYECVEFGKTVETFQPNAFMKILSGVVQDQKMSIDEYVKYLHRIAKIPKLASMMITLSLVFLQMTHEGEKFYINMFFKLDKRELKMYLDVPAGKFEYVKRKLNF